MAPKISPVRSVFSLQKARKTQRQRDNTENVKVESPRCPNPHKTDEAEPPNPWSATKLMKQSRPTLNSHKLKQSRTALSLPELVK